MSLLEMIDEHLDVADEEDRINIFAQTVLYLAQCTTAFKYQDFIRNAAVNISAKKFRLLVTKARYGLDIKLFALHIVKHKEMDRPKARSLAKQFGVFKDDYKAVYKLFEGAPWFVKKLRTKTNVLKWDYMNLACIEADFAEVYPAVHKYVKGQVYKKLLFISKSANEELRDLDSSVMIKVLQAYHRITPTDKSISYIQNYLKRVAHNHIINIIKSETTQKRGRLVNVGTDKNNERQFSLLCVSHNQAKLTLDENGDPVVPDAEDESSSLATFEVRFSIDELLKSYRKGSKKHCYLLIMLGYEDKRFTSWLQEKGYASFSEDNCDVQDRTSVAQFNQLIANYLRIEIQKIDDFLQTIRTKLAA